MKPRIEYCYLKDLKPWPGNPKGHDLGVIQVSIERFGFVKPVVLDEGTGRIVSGNGRCKVLRSMEEAGVAAPRGVKVGPNGWMVPALRGIRWRSAHEAGAFVLAANRLEEAGGWDDEALAGILQEHMAGGSLAGLGWKPEEVDRLLKGLERTLEKGKTPKELKQGFETSEEKAITFYFAQAQHDEVEKRVDALVEREELKDRSAALMWLLGWYRKARAAK